MVIASVGLAGFWFDRDVARTELNGFQRELLGIEEGTTVYSFVVAGRDHTFYGGMSTPMRAEDGSIFGWNYTGPRDVDGDRTDTILYVSIIGDDVTLIAIPRDLYLDAWTRRINTVYAVQGAEGLRCAVEVRLGLPVDDYAVINRDLF